MHHPGFAAPKKKFKSNYLYGAVDEAGDVKESDISLIGSIQSNRGGVGWGCHMAVAPGASLILKPSE